MSLQATPARDQDSGNEVIVKWTVLQTGTICFTYFIRHMQNKGFDKLMLNFIWKTWADAVIIVC